MSAAAVALVYLGTSDSVPLATAAVVGFATAAGMHARLATGRWPAAAQIVLSAALLSLAGAAPRLAGVVLVTGLAGAELIARCARRSAVLQAGAWSALVAGVVSAAGLAAAAPFPAGDALREAAAAIIGGFLGAPLMLALSPAAEWLFGHTTRLTMSEWLSYEHPLLRELASRAPGTFQHSVNVGVLADAAAVAIGADPLLARTGGLYHDVGKIRAPEYFIENQQGPNPHDRLDPRESARILRAHVSDGVEYVRAHRMGDQIASFVREHHGTGLMRFLLEKESSTARGASDETYRYPGPRPRSCETAIVMIADQLEATARSAPPEDLGLADEMVRRTVARIVEDGELADAGLTERELLRIRPALARALLAMYHKRIPYPPAGEGRPPRPTLTLVPKVLGGGRRGS